LVSARIDSAPLRELPWEDGLVAWARSYRLAFARHHRAVPLLMTTRTSAPVLLAEYEDFAVAAEAVGWASSEVLPLLTAFESFISAACSTCRGRARCSSHRRGRLAVGVVPSASDDARCAQIDCTHDYLEEDGTDVLAHAIRNCPAR
jgi:hypothetical protein